MRGYRKRFTRRKRERPWRTSVQNQDLGTFHGWDTTPLRRSVTCLSLFDGLSSALVALDELGFHIAKYYSCEIDPNAIRLQKYRFGSRLIQVGRVENLTPEKLDTFGEINLLIGGSPCQEVSLCNPRRKGIFDVTSSAHLFYNFVDIRNYLSDKAKRGSYDFHYVFENTAKLEKKTYNEFKRCLGCDAIQLCASWFLPVKRLRLFFTNISGIDPEPVLEDALTLEDILSMDRVPNVRVVPTLTTTRHSQYSGSDARRPVVEDGIECGLFISEIERLFGLSPGFTDGIDLSITSRRKLLGNAFCVPVIKHVLKPLTTLYRLKDDYQLGSVPNGI